MITSESKFKKSKKKKEGSWNRLELFKLKRKTTRMRSLSFRRKDPFWKMINIKKRKILKKG